jgi:hypothetical protein
VNFYLLYFDISSIFMNTKELNQLFQRDLSALMEELHAYTDEQNLWRIDQEISNSAGNLTLHLLGNLKQFVGLDLGGIAFERDRDGEFSSSRGRRDDLLQELALLKKMLDDVLIPLDPKKLGDQSKHSFFGHSMTVGFFLIHLYGHFNYHLGQINYHRRLLDK